MAERARDKNFRGIDKAAIILLSLPAELTKQLLSMMDVEEIRDLSSAMMTLGAVKSAVVEITLRDFANSLASTGSLVGSIESTERLLSSVLSTEQTDFIMEDLRGPAGSNVIRLRCNMCYRLL